jgi:nucleoside-diphosphate-sugar epimerase
MKKIFFAGASGVLRRRVLPQLVEAGYEVTAIGRSEAEHDMLKRLDAKPIELDLFNAVAERQAVAGHDVIINLATSASTIATIHYLKRGWAPVFGASDAYFYSVSHDDAAAAVVAALDLPAGIYNVVDDEPLTRREYVDSLARLLDVASPRQPPRWIVYFL